MIRKWSHFQAHYTLHFSLYNYINSSETCIISGACRRYSTYIYSSTIVYSSIYSLYSTYFAVSKFFRRAQVVDSVNNRCTDRAWLRSGLVPDRTCPGRQRSENFATTLLIVTKSRGSLEEALGEYVEKF